MHRFKFNQKELYCEDVPVKDIVKKTGTPVYIYSLNTFLDHYNKLKDAFKGINTLICFSTKSNTNLSVLNNLVKAGAGLDIVSGGELFKALKIKTNPKRIVFASVGKTVEEITDAVKAGILMFNVETVEELDVINAVAGRMRVKQKVALRINPDVKPKTHKYITTGSKDNKFGLSMAVAFKIYTEAYRYPFLKFVGVHVHIGSQITQAAPFVKAVKRVGAFIAKVRAKGVKIEYLNIGGGLGIVYRDEKPQTAKQFAAAVKPLLKKIKIKLILEPGRFVAGNSGIMITKVLYWKKTETKTFAIVDAGMNDLLRPSIYSAYHEIVPVIKNKSALQSNVDIVGPICESGDFLGKDRVMPQLKSGDLLSVMSCGAYGFTMASNYNSRPRVPEVVVKNKKFVVARKRETFEDLIRLERVVNV